MTGNVQQPIRGWLWRAAKLLILVFAVIGCGTTYDVWVGDPPLPGFLEPSTQQKTAWKDRYWLNSTLRFNYADADTDQKWEAFRFSRDVLAATAPDVDTWIRDIHRRGQLYFDVELPLDHPVYVDTVAYRIPVANGLILTPMFWKLTDVEKASVFVHEYRHAQQNFPKVMAERASQVVTLKVFWDPNDCRLEEEAYLYQHEFFKALGLRYNFTREYLMGRGLGFLL